MYQLFIQSKLIEIAATTFSSTFLKRRKLFLAKQMYENIQNYENEI